MPRPAKKCRGENILLVFIISCPTSCSWIFNHWAGEADEPVSIEVFITKLAVETLNAGVLTHSPGSVQYGGHDGYRVDIESVVEANVYL